MDEVSHLSEGIERAALADLHAAAPEETRQLLGLRLETIGTALVSVARHEPSILLNRTIGLGVEALDTQETVTAITSRYADDGVERYFLHLHPDAWPPELRDWITQAGLVRYRGWVKFHRAPVAPPELRSELRVRRIGVEHALEFGRIAAGGHEPGYVLEAHLP